MATASPSMDVGEELKCPICMEYLTDPVILDCGHNYCRGCITEYCEKWEKLGDLECSLCKARIKKGNFRPNFSLANIVEKFKWHSLSLGNEDLCMRHNEKLNLFCKEDQELVCVGCERSLVHQSHTVLLLEDAAEECRDKLCSCLEVLRKVRGGILTNEARTEKESQDLLSKIEADKTRTLALFNQLHQFLEEQKTHFLAQMENVKEEIVTRREENMARLMEELSSLEGLIQQIEEKCQQPARELLQDAGRTLQKCENRETFENPEVFPLALKQRTLEFCDMNLFLEGVITPFKEILASELQLQKVHVTLDPGTAHPQLILSEDCKGLRWGDKYQALPHSPERFDSCTSALGREGFKAGRHCWEVRIGCEGNWAVGVARKSVRRNGSLTLQPEKGIWAVGKWAKTDMVLARLSSALYLSGDPKRIKVTLSCDGGLVTFSDADTGALLCFYPEASFSGETLVPFFYVSGRGCLTIPP